MKLPWHRDVPQLLVKVRADVEAFSPTLHLFVEGDVIRIRGSFPVRHGSEEIDSYRVVIDLPSDYPDSLPIVRETGGRIPWTADRHISHGTACVLLPEDRWWSFPPGRSFLQFLQGPLHNYFLGQSLVEAGEEWPFGTFPHGIDGVRAFYKERFQTEDADTAVLLLELVVSGRYKRHWPCPCKSGKKMGKCHWATLLEMSSRMPRQAAAQSLINYKRGASRGDGDG